MPLTITFTPSSGSGSNIEYLELGPTSGKFAMTFDAGGAISDIKRWRVPGTNGYNISRCGAAGRKITLSVRYVGTLAEVIDQVQTDVDRMAGEAFDITTSDAAVTFSGCNLVPGSVMQTSPPLPQDDDNIFAEYVMQFTEDQPA